MADLLPLVLAFAIVTLALLTTSLLVALTGLLLVKIMHFLIVRPLEWYYERSQR